MICGATFILKDLWFNFADLLPTFISIVLLPFTMVIVFVLAFHATSAFSCSLIIRNGTSVVPFFMMIFAFEIKSPFIIISIALSSAYFTVPSSYSISRPSSTEPLYAISTFWFAAYAIFAINKLKITDTANTFLHFIDINPFLNSSIFLTLSPYIIKSFLLKLQAFTALYISVNKPEL